MAIEDGDIEKLTVKGLDGVKTAVTSKDDSTATDPDLVRTNLSYYVMQLHNTKLKEFGHRLLGMVSTMFGILKIGLSESDGLPP
jgi:hypothetical protein